MKRGGYFCAAEPCLLLPEGTGHRKLRRRKPRIHHVPNQQVLNVVLVENLWSSYLSRGDVVEKRSLSSSRDAQPASIEQPYVFADVTTSFTLLVGIFFPSVTGTGFGSSSPSPIADNVVRGLL